MLENVIKIKPKFTLLVIDIVACEPVQRYPGGDVPVRGSVDAAALQVALHTVQGGAPRGRVQVAGHPVLQPRSDLVGWQEKAKL